MPEQIPLYPYSSAEAQRNGELPRRRQSHEENIRCAEAVRQSINGHYRDNRLAHDAAKPVIEEFGYDRLFWVLANTVPREMDDGRISRDNKEWAKGVFIPPDDRNVDFIVNSHSGLLDLFINEARQRYKALDLFDRSHCESGGQSFQHRVLVLKPETLGSAYKAPDYQLFYATGGFGCSPDARGRKVMGQFLMDGEKEHFHREDFIGVLKDEFLPEWAAENLTRLQTPCEQEDGPALNL